LVLNHDFVIYIDFTHAAASDTDIDDVTNLVTHTIGYLIHTNNIFVLILYSKLLRNVAALAISNTI